MIIYEATASSEEDVEGIDAYDGSFRKKSTLLSFANGFILAGAMEFLVNYQSSTT